MRWSCGSSTPTTGGDAERALGKLTPVEFELAFTPQLGQPPRNRPHRSPETLSDDPGGINHLTISVAHTPSSAA